MNLFKENLELKQIIDEIELNHRSESNNGYFTQYNCEVNFGTKLKFKIKIQMSGE